MRDIYLDLGELFSCSVITVCFKDNFFAMSTSPPWQASSGDPRDLPDPPSSPLTIDPPSSPVRSDPPSSPYVDPPSSPPEPSSSPPEPKRCRYEFNELEIPYDPKYWPGGEDVNRNDACGYESDSMSVISDQDKIGTEAAPHDDQPFSDLNRMSPLNREEHDVGMEVDDRFDPHNLLERHAHYNFPAVALTDSSSSDSEASTVSVSVHSASDQSEINQDSSSSSEEDNVDQSSSEEDNDAVSDGADSESSISDAKVHSSCELTLSEGVLVLMDLFLENNLSKKTIGKFTQAVQKFMPKDNYMPKTQHELFKFVTDRCPPVPVRTHYYCQVCLFYLGEENISCTLCKGESKKFYQLLLGNQIKIMFEQHDLADSIDKYAEEIKNRQQAGCYSDICDGMEYKRSHCPGRYNLTLIGHTDGLQITESSDIALWPLEWVIVELPHFLRFKFLMISGVWVDDNHPYMNSYLKPFVDELKDLYDNGVKWIHPKTKTEEISFVTAPAFCADAPVRADIQNILHHGGRYCCHLCEQKMVLLEAEPAPPGCENPPKRKRVFQFQEVPSRLRSAERMQAQAHATRERQRVTPKSKPVKGVKGYTIVTDLPMCDRSTVVFPEYMHLLLGIVKLFMELWFETDGDWTLKNYRDEINIFLRSIRVPDYITRIIRSTDCYSKWKANELRTFLLYISPIILSKYMDAEYSQHWMLIVGGMHLLLQETISESDITKADLLFKMFLRDFSRLYPKKKFTYNLHELSHLAFVTRLWGPIFLTSAFWFESYNGQLTKCIHGSKEQGKELVNTIQLIQGVQILKARAQPRARSRNQTCLRNRVKKIRFDRCQKELLASSELLQPITAYYRACVDGDIFTSSIYSRQQKRNNYTVCFSTAEGQKNYGEIMFFVCSEDSGDQQSKIMAFVKCFEIEHLRVLIHNESQFVLSHIIPIQESENVVLVPLENITSKVIRIDDYICIRPNKVEVNL